jgi:uncharacterized protein (TIGR00251 family)
MTFAVRQAEGAITFDVQVVPRASGERIGPVVGDRLKVQLTAPPVEGAANEALCAALGKALGVGRARVEIVRGEGSRRKTVRVAGASAEAVLALAGERSQRR